MKSNRTTLSLIIVLALVLVSNIALAESLIVANKVNLTIYKDDKISISKIDGWEEAVKILENSIINSLLGTYTSFEPEAAFTISGNIFAKKHWRKRIYVYHTISLRVLDQTENIVMTIKNSRPLWQTELDQFTEEMTKSIKASMITTGRTTAPAVEVHTLSAILKDAQTVYSFDTSPDEEVRACITKIEGMSYIDLRVYNQTASGKYKASEKGVTVPTELLEELEMAVSKLRENISQNK